MSTLLFETLVVSAQAKRARRGRLSVPLSLGLHALALAGLATVSLLPQVDLPAAEPPKVRAGIIYEPVRVQPTQAPARAAQPRRSAEARPAVPAPPSIAVPRTVPGDLPPADMGPPPDPRAVLADGDECPNCVGPTGVPTQAEGRGDGPADFATPRVVVVGHGVQAPRKLRNVVPVYPELAKRTSVHGTVVIECTIDTHGLIVGARVLHGHPLLSPAALAAVTQWTYTPTLLAGVPVAVILTVTVHFGLDNR